jgi:hypothetical protein
VKFYHRVKERQLSLKDVPTSLIISIQVDLFILEGKFQVKRSLFAQATGLRVPTTDELALITTEYNSYTVLVYKDNPGR